MSEITLSAEPLATGRPLLPPPPIVAERGLTPAQWGMASFLVSEVAFFSTLIVVYLTFLGADQSGPTPALRQQPNPEPHLAQDYRINHEVALILP